MQFWPVEAMAPAMQPSYRKLVGTGLIVLVIALWAAFVASLARVVGGWPVLVQAPYYLVMGLAWIIPLKPLVRWMQTGFFRAGGS
jgi:predicted membrane channel-forming protein YqfA (hemolysin III family)